MLLLQTCVPEEGVNRVTFPGSEGGQDPRGGWNPGVCRGAQVVCQVCNEGSSAWFVFGTLHTPVTVGPGAIVWHGSVHPVMNSWVTRPGALQACQDWQQ